MVLRAGAVLATSRCWSLGRVLRDQAVNLRAEVGKGWLIAKFGEDISKLLFRRDELGDNDLVRYPVPQSCRSYCNVSAPVGMIAVRWKEKCSLLSEDFLKLVKFRHPSSPRIPER